ncbi:hypothetical protein RRG08_053044 [Elysia crispata]|uniref:Uncharacterized protein n=1 Tax=Elysia crispata TaxID=231223 RepID=A0AAE0XTD9_9GAST|nr:hypothetical protein RRG08_053044 [Elysia crispata]
MYRFAPRSDSTGLKISVFTQDIWSVSLRLPPEVITDWSFNAPFEGEVHRDGSSVTRPITSPPSPQLTGSLQQGVNQRKRLAGAVVKVSGENFSSHSWFNLPVFGQPRTVDHREQTVISSTVDHREQTVISAIVDHREQTVISAKVDHREQSVISASVDHREQTVISAIVDHREQSVISATVDHREQTVISAIVDHREQTVISAIVDHREQSVISATVDHREQTVISAIVDHREQTVITATVDHREQTEPPIRGNQIPNRRSD